MQYIFDEQGNRFIDCISNVQRVFFKFFNSKIVEYLLEIKKFFS